MMGDGVDRLPTLRPRGRGRRLHRDIEVEIFNQEIWDTPGEQTLRPSSAGTAATCPRSRTPGVQDRADPPGFDLVHVTGHAHLR